MPSPPALLGYVVDYTAAWKAAATANTSRIKAAQTSWTAAIAAASLLQWSQPYPVFASAVAAADTALQAALAVSVIQYQLDLANIQAAIDYIGPCYFPSLALAATLLASRFASVVTVNAAYLPLYSPTSC
jgi:hypothetical protein